MPAFSFDHLIRAGEERGRDAQAEGLRGPEVDGQLELSWLFHRQLAGLLTLENLVDEAGEPEIKVGIVHRVRDQSPALDELAGRINDRQAVARRKVDNRLLMR